MILALDLGHSTGWALSERHTVAAFGIWTTPADLPLVERYWSWWNRLDRLMLNNEIDCVIYEEAFQRGGNAARIFGGYRALVMHAASITTEHVRSVRLRSVHATTLKKWATGNARAPKALMCERAAEYAGRALDPKTENDIADAILLLAWATNHPHSEPPREKG